MKISGQYNRVYSLGAWCKVSHQIWRRLGKNWHSPYDWLVTPFDALLSSLNDEGDRFGKTFEAWDGGKDVFCQEYGLLYHHEFKRLADARIIFSKGAIEACRSKLLHKMHVMRESVQDGSTLFIRFGGEAQPPKAWPYIRDGELPASKLNALAASLRRFTQGSSFKLLYVYHPEIMPLVKDQVLDPDLLLYAFESYGSLPEIEGWRGDPANWDLIFDQITVAS